MNSQKSLWWKATFSIKDKLEEKINRLKDPTYAALTILEFVLCMIILVGLLLYIDPKRNVIQAPFNFIIVGGIIFVVLHIYRYTNFFRKYNTKKRKSSLKILFLELLISAILIGSTFIYQDATLNTLAYPFNFLLFLAILCIPLYFYINEKFVE